MNEKQILEGRLLLFEIFYTEQWVQDIRSFVEKYMPNADLVYCINVEFRIQQSDLVYIQEMVDDLFKYKIFSAVSDNRLIILVFGCHIDMNKEIEKANALYERIKMISGTEEIRIGIGSLVKTLSVKKSVNESIEAVNKSDYSVVYYCDLEVDADNNHKWIIGIFLEYVANNYSSNISLYDVSEYLHLSPNYLSSIIKHSLGKSYIKFLSEYRIKKAKELLKTTRLSAKIVGDKVGYPDPIYFNRVFKNITGLTPIEYRKTVE